MNLKHNAKIKTIVRTALSAIGLEGFGRLFLQDSALKKWGWFHSVRHKQSINAEGNPQPWFTYSFLQFIEERFRPDSKLFEYGAGMSTIYYAERVCLVHSVEHDSKWHSQVQQRIGDTNKKNIVLNLQQVAPELESANIKDLSFVDDDTNPYVKNISLHGVKYDIVVVDGLHRNSCAIESIRHLSDEGVVIVDNTHYAHQLARSSEELKNAGFKRIDFWGMCAIYSQLSCTTVFYKDGNCLGI